MSDIKLFENKQARSTWSEARGKWYFSVQDAVEILNVFAEKELEETDSVRKIGISDFSAKPTNICNLDVIISVDYRVKSQRGTQFGRIVFGYLKTD